MNVMPRSAVRPSVRTVDAIIIGAGHAGLAFSRCLSRRGIEHIVLERGEVADAWRNARWDSLRLLTPNWQNRLPDYVYTGADRDGFMTMPEVVAYLSDYCRVIDAPVHTHTDVTSVSSEADGYRVTSDQGVWWTPCVVLASGACNAPIVPKLAAAVPASVAMVTPMTYRNASALRPGGVLVVGASATGLQLAEEIARSGRAVTLAVGEHIRMPRTYRGRDIQYWMEAIGVLDERFDAVDDIVRARRVPSPQLVGTADRSSLDLNVLSARGVQCVGRFVGVAAGRAQFSGSLLNHCAMADLKMIRLLDRIDVWIARNCDGVDAVAERPAPTLVEREPRLALDLAGGEINTIIWATGYRPDYRWLDVPVLDDKDRIRHSGGVVESPGMYVMGLTFMRRRRSSFIHGADADARDLSEHIARYLDCRARR